MTTEYLLTRTGRDDAEGAARLAKSLGGLPLAAEQAAGFLATRKGISFDDYAAEIARLIKEPRPAGAKGDYPDTVYAAFVKSLETLQAIEGHHIALDILRLCAFLSPDGVDLDLLTVDSDGKFLPRAFTTAMTDKFVREDALSALDSLSLLRREVGPVGESLVFHRLLLEVTRDWMGEDARAFWADSATRLLNAVCPSVVSTDPSVWPLCARLMPHVASLEAHIPGTSDAGRAIERLLGQTAVYLVARGDHLGALTLFEKVVALMRSAPDQPLELATALSNLGYCSVKLDRLADAERAFGEALKLQQAHLDRNDLSLSTTFTNLAEVHWKRGEFDKAEPLLLRDAEVVKVAKGTDSAEYGLSLSNLGALYGNWADEPGETVRRERSNTRRRRLPLRAPPAACGIRKPPTGTKT